MLLIVGGIVAVFLAHRKVAEKITEEEYQRFLDGEVPAMKENGKTYFLEDLFGEDVSDVETFLLYRKFLKSSEIVYNRLEIKNDITKERRGLRHDVVYEVFCFGLG